MRKLLTLAMASAAAFAMPTVASAQAVNVDATGTPDAYQVFGISSTGNPVYGSAPNNTNVASVRFDANTNTDMGITNGAAIITDDGAADWTWVTINPDLDFTDMKFDISLVGTGSVQLFYILAGGPTSDANYPSNYLLSCATCTFSANGADNHYEFSGGTFNGIMLKVLGTNTIYSVKQISFTPAGSSVPEPATWGLMLLGFGGMGMALRRSRRRGKQNLMQIA